MSNITLGKIAIHKGVPCSALPCPRPILVDGMETGVYIHSVYTDMTPSLLSSCKFLLSKHQKDNESRPSHRPRLDSSAARINFNVRVHPNTKYQILNESKKTGESQGQVLDRIVSYQFQCGLDKQTSKNSIQIVNKINLETAQGADLLKQIDYINNELWLNLAHKHNIQYQKQLFAYMHEVVDAMEKLIGEIQ